MKTKKERKLKQLEEYLYDAIENLESDRASASVLLMDLMILLKANPILHEKHGLVAAKYLETLQRSNEQLVKAVELLRKKKENINKVEEGDVEEIYDKLSGESE